MPEYRTFQTSFTSGEFDQKLRDRTDTKAYFEGAQKMRNFALLSQGGFTRRCGTFFRSYIPTESRIIPFEYSAEDALILCLSDEQLDVYSLDGALYDTVSGCPWTTDDLYQIKYTQRGNAMFLAHNAFPVQVVLRNSNTGLFSVDDIQFYTGTDDIVYQPYSLLNVNRVVKFEVSSLGTGSRTLTASEDYFEASDVGTFVRLEGGYGEITGYTDPQTVTINQMKNPRRNLIEDPIQTSNGSDLVKLTVPGHNFSVGDVISVENVVAVNGLSSGQLTGNRTITQVRDQNTVVYEADASANSTGFGGGVLAYIEFTGPTPLLYEQSFSEGNGYPNAIAIHEERLWLGGTIVEPDTIWASKTSNFDIFDIGEGLPNDAIQVRIDAGSVNEIRHIVSSRHLQVLTNQNEFYVPSSETQAITPETIVIRKQTPYGSSHVRASLFDGATIFVQDSGRSVREFLYTDREFAYNARNIALLSQHLIEDPIDIDTIYGALLRPEQYAFFVNATGTMTVLHAIRSEEIVGWVQWETDGLFKSVAVVGQRVFIGVDRDGSWSLEEFDMTFEYFMDGMIGFTAGGPTTTWGPAPEYANQEIAVTSGPYFLGYADVDGSGYFNTDDPYESVEIGLNYPSWAQTMQVAFALPDGPMTGLPLRVTRAVVDFGNSATIQVDGQRLILRQTTDFPGNPPEPYDKKEEFWIDQISRNPSIEIYQDIPLKTEIYSILIEVAF